LKKMLGGMPGSVVGDKESLFPGDGHDNSFRINRTTGQIIWQKKAGGFFSPGISSDKVIFTSADYELLCLNQSDGRVIWKRKLFGGGSGAICVFQGKLYVDDFIRILCIDAETGNVIWNRKFNTAPDESPVASDGSVFIGSAEGVFYCLDSKNGKTKWEYTFPFQQGQHLRPIPGPAIVVGNRVISCSTTVVCLEADTGKEVWSFKPDGEIGYVSPTTDGESVFIPDQKGNLFCLSIATGKQVWHTKSSSSYMEGCVTEGYLYITNLDGYLHCIDVSTGKDVWEYNVTEGGPRHTPDIHYPGPPILINDTLILASENGYLYWFGNNNK